MKKQITAILTAVLILGSITGCSNNESNPPYSVGSSGSSENISESETESNDNSTVSENFNLTKSDAKQIVELFKDWGDLDYNIHPDETNTNREYFPDCVDKTQFITEEITRRGSTKTYTEYFYKVVEGDFSTEYGFNKRLDEMFSENLKENYWESSSGAMFRFKDGETYVAGFGHYMESKPEITLNISAEFLDEDTIAVTVSQLIGETTGDNQYKATLVKGANGVFKIYSVGKDDGSFSGIPQLFSNKNVKINILQDGNVSFTF